MKRRLWRLAAMCALVGAAYFVCVLIAGALIFDDWLHDWSWWQSGLIWLTFWLVNKAVTPHTTAWIKKEKVEQ